MSTAACSGFVHEVDATRLPEQGGRHPSVTRRRVMSNVLRLLSLFLSSLIGAIPGVAMAQSKVPIDWASVKLESIGEGLLPTAEYKGKVVLVVNTASFCGFTDQYEGLEALWRRYKDK